jgi:hypothetical protein
MATMQRFTKTGVVLIEVDDPTEEELAALDQERSDAHALHQKDLRFNLLLETDWTQGPDSPLSDEDKALWATYRTQLRDITSHENWPDLEPDDWPTKPS